MITPDQSMPDEPSQLTPSDREFLDRLHRLKQRRTATRAARDEAMAILFDRTSAADALTYLGLDLDELRREP